MYDSTIFNRYINEIGDPKIQEIVEECLQKCPKEFYTMPASTTGKYHPPFALGEGGFVGLELVDFQRGIDRQLGLLGICRTCGHHCGCDRHELLPVLHSELSCVVGDGSAGSI